MVGKSKPAAVTFFVLAFAAQSMWLTPSRSVEQLGFAACCGDHCGRSEASEAPRCCELERPDPRFVKAANPEPQRAHAWAVSFAAAPLDARASVACAVPLLAARASPEPIFLLTRSLRI